MKTTFSSNSELCHQFANNRDESRNGKASNIFFEGVTLYSYGYHFILAKKIFVDGYWITFINANKDSISTAKHQNHVRQSLNGKTTINIPFASNRHFDLSDLIQISIKLKDDINTALKAQIKARSNDYHLRGANNTLTLLRELNNRFPEYVETIHSVEQTFPLWAEAMRKAETIQASQQERSLRKLELEKIVKEKQAVEERKNLSAWLSGLFNGQLYNLPIHLRLSTDKKQVETSHGAKVPTLEAVQMFKDIQDCKDITGRQIGYFQVREITLDYVQIGCHKIEFQFINKFMEGLSLCHS